MPRLRLEITGAVLFLAATTASAAPDVAQPFVPTYRANFPDPFILQHGGRFFAYATNTDEGRANVQMASSPDLVSWQPVTDAKAGGKLHDAMPTLPVWASRGRTWAPEVLKTPSGFLLYFTARNRKTDLQCVGVASSQDPLGPFTSTAEQPLVCQEELGGTIDAHPFRDADGQLYLYYKNDGNNPRFLKPSQIWGQRLSPDGLRLIGKAEPLVKNDVHWEWRVVEAPAMIRNPSGGYTMFFSANHFGWELDQRLSNYATGYAQCRGPLGPCTDAGENPILHSYYKPKSGCLSGPGHPALFNAGGRSFIAFHAWSATASCRKAENKRALYIAPLIWSDGKPGIGPSVRRRPK